MGAWCPALWTHPHAGVAATRADHRPGQGCVPTAKPWAVPCGHVPCGRVQRGCVPCGHATAAGPRGHASARPGSFPRAGCASSPQLKPSVGPVLGQGGSPMVYWEMGHRAAGLPSGSRQNGPQREGGGRAVRGAGGECSGRSAGLGGAQWVVRALQWKLGVECPRHLPHRGPASGTDMGPAGGPAPAPGRCPELPPPHRQPLEAETARLLWAHPVLGEWRGRLREGPPSLLQIHHLPSCPAKVQPSLGSAGRALARACMVGLFRTALGPRKGWTPPAPWGPVSSWILGAGSTGLPDMFP